MEWKKIVNKTSFVSVCKNLLFTVTDCAKIIDEFVDLWFCEEFVTKPTIFVRSLLTNVLV